METMRGSGSDRERPVEDGAAISSSESRPRVHFPGRPAPLTPSGGAGRPGENLILTARSSAAVSAGPQEDLGVVAGGLTSRSDAGATGEIELVARPRQARLRQFGAGFGRGGR